jgi:transcriptional regulator with XRE-family HTH domain
VNETVEIPAASRELRDARRAAGLTQRELAVLAGCSVGTIANWEQGLLPRAYSRVWGIVWDALSGHTNANGAPDQGAAADDRASEEPHRDET